MSGIINALFGHHKDKDDKKHVEKTTATTATSSSGSNVVAHTAVSDDVHVHSVVSSESNSSITMQNSKKIADLLAKLGRRTRNQFDWWEKKLVGTTHSQVDQYSKKRTDEINDAVANSIEKVVAETAVEQQKLLADANQRAAAIEEEYKQRLQERVAQLDTEKAVLLAELERKLNARQETILAAARDNIDAVQNAANEQKLAVFREAQAKANQQVDQITEKVAVLAAEDAQRRLQSTTQTVRLFSTKNSPLNSSSSSRSSLQKQLQQVKLMSLVRRRQQQQLSINLPNLIHPPQANNCSSFLLFFFIYSRWFILAKQIFDVELLIE